MKSEGVGRRSMRSVLFHSHSVWTDDTTCRQFPTVPVAKGTQTERVQNLFAVPDQVLAVQWWQPLVWSQTSVGMELRDF